MTLYSVIIAKDIDDETGEWIELKIDNEEMSNLITIARRNGCDFLIKQPNDIKG